MNGNPRNKTALTILVAGITLILSAGIYALAFFFMGILVFACQNSIPDWIYMILVAGMPAILLSACITTVYLYYRRQSLLTAVIVYSGGVFFSGMLFIAWFLMMANYC